MILKEKIKHLNQFIKSKYKVNLYDVLNIDEKTFEEKTNNNTLDCDTLEKICGIFYLNYDEFIDDNIDLPHDDHLRVDELLIKINQGNLC